MTEKSGESSLSLNIDRSMVFGYMLHRFEACNGDAVAEARELAPHDVDELPTPAEIYACFQRTAAALLERLRDAVNEDQAFFDAPLHDIASERIDRAQKISVMVKNIPGILYVLQQLECDDLSADARFQPIVPVATESGLAPLQSWLISLKAQKKEVEFEDDLPTFAHKATDMYFCLMEELLFLAKPFEDDGSILPEYMNGDSLPRLPERTIKWINRSRLKAGYPSLER